MAKLTVSPMRARPSSGVFDIVRLVGPGGGVGRAVGVGVGVGVGAAQPCADLLFACCAPVEEFGFGQPPLSAEESFRDATQTIADRSSVAATMVPTRIRTRITGSYSLQARLFSDVS